MPCRAFAAAVALVLVSVPTLAQTGSLDALEQFESGGQNIPQQTGATNSTASGLYQITNTTENTVIAPATGLPTVGPGSAYPDGVMDLTPEQQEEAAAYLYETEGFSPWTCSGCNAQLAAYVASQGGASAFGLTSGEQQLLASVDPDAASGAASATPGDTGTGTTATAGSGGLTVTTTTTGTSTVNGGVLDQIVSTFQTATAGWQTGLYTVGLDLFWLLAIIDLFAALILLVINGGRPDWSDVVFTILRWLFPVGLFLWLMQNGSTFAQDIVNSLRQAGTVVGGTAITPSTLMTAGFNTVSMIWYQNHSVLHPAVLVAVMIAIVVIMIAFALSAVWMAAALIEAYFVIGAAALFLAFGGMRWSREIAVALLRFCLGIGMKLFAIELIVPVSAQFAQQWANVADQQNMQGVFIIIGASIFLAALSKIVPDTMQRVILAAPISLAHFSQPIRQAQGTAALAPAPVLAAGGFTVLLVQALLHAAEQLAAANQQDQGRLSCVGQMTGAAGGAIARAAGSEIGGRLGGLYRGGAAASLTRMAGNIAQQRRVSAAQRNRPQPPGNTP